MIHISVKPFEEIFIEHKGLIGTISAKRKPNHTKDIIVSFHADTSMRVYRTGSSCEYPPTHKTIMNTPINEGPNETK